MGLKEETVAAIGFKRLAIFQPGIIGGNKHRSSVSSCRPRRIPMSAACTNGRQIPQILRMSATVSPMKE